MRAAPEGSIVHLYSSCQVINIFWDDIFTNINAMANSLTPFKKLITGTYGNKNYTLINKLLIIGRCCIYAVA